MYTYYIQILMSNQYHAIVMNSMQSLIFARHNWDIIISIDDYSVNLAFWTVTATVTVIIFCKIFVYNLAYIFIYILKNFLSEKDGLFPQIS